MPHAAIIEYAESVDADLIVVGTHGYGPIKHLRLGSVAERVVRQAACPVMTVPHRSVGAAGVTTTAAATRHTPLESPNA